MKQKNKQEILVVIPARGGSKGIPRKNLQLIAGVPLVGRSVVCATQAQCVTRVVVSTDDQEIAAAAKKYGADVIMRPETISTDTTPSELAILHVLTYLREKERYIPDITIFMQCTAPLTIPADIEGAVTMYNLQKADCVFTATPFSHFLWRVDASGSPYGVNHNASVRLMRQQRELEYMETGGFFILRTAGFTHAKHRFFGKMFIYEIPSERCLDIDTIDDLRLAESKLNKQSTQPLPKNV